MNHKGGAQNDLKLKRNKLYYHCLSKSGSKFTFTWTSNKEPIFAVHANRESRGVRKQTCNEQLQLNVF